MTSRKMILGMQFRGGYGAEPGAWRLPGANLNSYTDMDQFVRYAQSAERGKVQLLFIADTPVLDMDLTHHAPRQAIDPLLLLTVLARETERIGLVTTASTTFNEPYNLARQFKALDVISHGRAGWNAVTTSDPAAAANFGSPVPPRTEKYERAHEVIQIVQGLWGSWEKDALLLDVEGKRYADMDKIQPVNLQGKHAASRGPLPIPPSEQGQPVIFQAGGGSYGLEIAGRYASGVYANPYTIEDARAQREALRDAAKRAGRDPDEVKMLAGFMPTIAPSRQAALQRRRFLDEVVDLDQRVRYLGAVIGLPLGPGQLDRPLTAEQLADAVPSPHDPRAARALEVAREGWSLRDVIAHGVIDHHPVVAGTAANVADHMQQWFEAGACDGFSIALDGFDAFVDQVVPILQERGLFHEEYEGPTLRENLGAHQQYGLDPRISQQARPRPPRRSPPPVHRPAQPSRRAPGPRRCSATPGRRRIPGCRGHCHGGRSPARHHGQRLHLASLAQPMVLVSLDNCSQLLALVHRTGRFGLNILGAHQAELATALARSGPDKSA